MLTIFGANGQLGQELCAMARNLNITAVALGHSEVDIAEPEQVEAAFVKYRPSVVVNAAAYTAVDRAESEPMLAKRVNVQAPEVIARTCAIRDAAMIHISTDYVFGGSKVGSYREDDPIAPQSVYGWTKAEGEQRVRIYLSRHIILRTSWLYGAYGANFLKTILRLSGEQDELQVVDDQIGCPTGTADLAAAILRTVEAIHALRPVWGTYHFAGTGAVSWHGFASEIVRERARITGKSPKVYGISSAEYPTAARRPMNSELDSSKFAATFGFRAVPWQERTAEVVKRLCRADVEEERL